MSSDTKSIWEKISILTSFIASVTALTVTIAGLVTVQVESSKSDVVVSSPMPSVQQVEPSADSVLPAATQTMTAKGWAYIGQTKLHGNLAVGDKFTFEQATNIRSDYPRFPFYQFAPITEVIPNGTEVEVLDLRKNVGARNFTWIFVNASWEVEIK